MRLLDMRLSGGANFRRLRTPPPAWGRRVCESSAEACYVMLSAASAENISPSATSWRHIYALDDNARGGNDDSNPIAAAAAAATATATATATRT